MRNRGAIADGLPNGRQPSRRRPASVSSRPRAAALALRALSLRVGGRRSLGLKLLSLCGLFRDFCRQLHQKCLTGRHIFRRPSRRFSRRVLATGGVRHRSHNSKPGTALGSPATSLPQDPLTCSCRAQAGPTRAVLCSCDSPRGTPEAGCHSNQWRALYGGGSRTVAQRP